MLVARASSQLDQLLFQLGSQRSDLVSSSLHRRPAVRSTAFLTQRLVALDTVDCCRRDFAGPSSTVLLQAGLARNLASHLARRVLGVYQMLDEEVVLKALQTVGRDLERLPAQRTRDLVSRHLVREVTLETGEAEPVDAGQ